MKLLIKWFSFMMSFHNLKLYKEYKTLKDSPGVLKVIMVLAIGKIEM